MNETPVTIIGNAVEDPIRRTTRNGDRYVTFRLASTVRRRDASGSYVDAGTNFVTVVAFRQLAENIADSVRKGHPLVVAGRLRVNQWRAEDGRTGTSVEVDATTVGHDLTRGIARFNRVRAGQIDGSFPPAVPEAPRPESGEDPWAVAPTGAVEQPTDDDFGPAMDRGEGERDGFGDEPDAASEAPAAATDDRVPALAAAGA